MTIQEKFTILAFLGGIFAVYFAELVLILTWLYRKSVRRKGRVLLGKVAVIIHFLAVFGLICALYGFLIEPYWIDINTVTIETDKLKNTTLKVVQISDMHCETEIRNEKKIVKIINGIKPDVIVFTGDSINTPEAAPLFRETMTNLKADIAKLAVYGNWRKYNSDVDILSGTGFDLLDQRTARLTQNGEVFYISGFSVPAKRYREVLEDVPDDKLSILLYHNSDLAELLEGLNVDLYLSGHTHGGQIALPIYGALITLSKHGKKYESGMYNIGDTTLYVNRGIGLEGSNTPKARFFARPEITVFEIKPAKKLN